MSSKNLNIGPRANLRGAHLEGRDLRGADLRGALLEGAYLEGAHLEGAHLERAYLERAHLEGAYLEGALLEGAHLEGAYLKGAHLEGAILREAKLTAAHLEGAILREAKLKGAVLSWANLKGVDLRGATLDSVDLTGTDLKDAQLNVEELSEIQKIQIEQSEHSRKILKDISEISVIPNSQERQNKLVRLELRDANLNFANLQGAHLEGAFLTRAHLRGANLEGAFLTRAHLIGANLKGANLTRAYLGRANLREAHLEGAFLIRANLNFVDLQGAHLYYAHLHRAFLTEANLTNADLTNADLTDAELIDADLTDADLTDAHLTNADLTGADLTRADLTGITGENTIIGLNTVIFNEINNKIKFSIIIKKDLLNIKKSSNNSCPNYKELYDFVISHDLSNPFKFEYVGQAGVDVGGLTRDIFEKMLPVYTHKFFEEIDSNNDFVILKQNVNQDIFIRETQKMMFLSKAAKTFIFLKIDPRLLDLLKSEKPKEFINNSKKESFSNLFTFFEENIFKLKLEGQNLNEVELDGYFINNNKSNYFKNNNSKRTLLLKNQFQQLENSIKKEILIRRFLIMCGFKTINQFENMITFIKSFWNPAYFLSELKFDIETFSKNLKISKQNLRLEYINIPLEKFGELSIDKTKFNFKDNFNRNTTSLFTEYSIFRPFLEFLLGTDSSDENRKLFISRVAGSAYYTGEITIKLSNSTAVEMRRPFKATTCFFYIELYKSVAKENNGNLSNIINSIKVQLEHDKDFRWA